MSDELEGFVERIGYANEETGFAVLTLRTKDGESKLVGPLTGVKVGEHIRAFGKQERDARFGDQLRVEHWVPVTPTSKRGIRRYLASGVVDGIGGVIAERLVDHFGDRTFEVIENEPERLREVKGIGKKRIAQIRAAWDTMRAAREVMVYLQGLDLGPAQAARVAKTYGAQAARVVREDPYRLIRDIRGVGFETADRIARATGIATDAPARLAAGIVHVLGELADDGHVYAEQGALLARAAEVLGVHAELLPPVLALLDGDQLVLEESRVYLRELYSDEVAAAAALRALARAPAPKLDLDVARALEQYERAALITLAPAQADAIERAVRGKLLVITGGPGTGKTTIVNGILRVLRPKRRRILLAAPTGRAAKRLAETTGQEAKTIHRLLEMSPAEGRFLKDAMSPLEVDTLIVDEASMLDITLFRRLLEATPPSAQLVLVGDVDQLPSVGPGQVLGDLIDSGVVEVARLTAIFRQAANSRIVVNAHAINEGRRPEPSPAPDGDFFIIERSDPIEARVTIESLLAERIPERFGLDPIEDVQVLAPMHKGELGTERLNAVLQARLNPVGDTLERGGTRLRVGDKVMQLKNDYERDVFNGDIGRIAAIRPAEKEVEIDFDGRRVRYELKDLDAIQLAYACSIHKSQGSEYPAVIVVMHTTHWVMLRKNLLYTAVTRGKRLVVLVGATRAILRCLDERAAPRRNTTLAERIRA